MPATGNVTAVAPVSRQGADGQRGIHDPAARHSIEGQISAEPPRRGFMSRSQRPAHHASLQRLGGIRAIETSAGRRGEVRDDLPNVGGGLVGDPGLARWRTQFVSRPRPGLLRRHVATERPGAARQAAGAVMIAPAALEGLATGRVVEALEILEEGLPIALGPAGHVVGAAPERTPRGDGARDDVPRCAATGFVRSCGKVSGRWPFALGRCTARWMRRSGTFRAG